MTASDKERTAIHEAYWAALKALYGALYDTLIVGDPDDRKACIDRFSQGLMRARQARDLALDLL